jgi:hypothetical protein
MPKNRDWSYYQSYLLRLWQMDNDGRPVWRMSLESTRSGETQHFKSAAEFYAFVEALISASDTSANQGGESKLKVRIF